MSISENEAAGPDQPDRTSDDASSRSGEDRAGGEEPTGLEPGLEAGEDHGPTAVELVMGAFSQLVAGDGEAARVADRLDLPDT